MATKPTTKPATATVLAGVPLLNKAVYHRIRFFCGDPAVFIQFDTGHRLLIIRDVELQRASRHARADEFHVPADFAPSGGLSGDRPIATAQAAAECLVRHGVQSVRADRSIPFLFVDELQRRGIAVACDRDLGVIERRQKDAQEVEYMRHVQGITEDAIRMACERIARAPADDDGFLLDVVDDGDTSDQSRAVPSSVSGRDPDPVPGRHRQLTGERIMSLLDVFLAERGCTSNGHIVAGGPEGGDCHNRGGGPLRSGAPIIIDVFPCFTATGYYGDCTRMVVHGRVPPEVARMHATVAEAKRVAIAAMRTGVTGEAVHLAAVKVIEAAGYKMGFPPPNAPADFCSMPHGTGHGLGLDLKEPPLLDMGGPPLVTGDAITVEPGLYAPALGGMRLEDLVIVTPEGTMNLNRLPEGMDWRA